jgi:hypothetical protein
LLALSLDLPLAGVSSSEVFALERDFRLATVSSSSDFDLDFFAALPL